MNNKLIEKVEKVIEKESQMMGYDALITKKTLNSIERSKKLAKAALKALEDEGHVCIDELIERAEKEFSDVGKCGALVGVPEWLKQIKTEGKG